MFGMFVERMHGVPNSTKPLPKPKRDISNGVLICSYQQVIDKTEAETLIQRSEILLKDIEKYATNL